jgi:spoIIIJ-associated protein
MPTSFVSTQDDEDEEYDVSNYLADYDDEEDEQDTKNISEIALVVKKEINNLFDSTCFKIDSIEVSGYDENTLLIEFKGDDAALLIGKEGYRYKALSYMIFNWINTKYQVQLRLEIAEFLKNQEESIRKYLVGVCENIDRDGRAQTKILDGVLVQIALKELRDKYPNKYIVIRSTRDGLKYIIINDYHAN